MVQGLQRAWHNNYHFPHYYSAAGPVSSGASRGMDINSRTNVKQLGILLTERKLEAESP